MASEQEYELRAQRASVWAGVAFALFGVALAGLSHEMGLTPVVIGWMPWAVGGLVALACSYIAYRKERQPASEYQA